MASVSFLTRHLLTLVLVTSGLLAGPPAPAQDAPGTTAPAPGAAERNVYAGGGQVRPGGPVKGDFMAGGGRVIVDQPVAGDAMVAGGAVDVRAPVGDDVRAMGGDISIESTVGGELFASGGQVSVRPTAAVTGGARLHGGTVAMEGRIGGTLRAGGQKVVVNGEVRGDVHLSGAQLELGPQARIGGALTYASDADLKKAEGAVVSGAITREPLRRQQREGIRGVRASGPGAVLAGGVMSFLALLACGAVFLLLAPTFGEHATERIRGTPWLVLALGFAALVAVPVLAVLLFITLLGIPLGFAVMALYPVLLLAGFVVGVLFMARLLSRAMRKAPASSFGASVGWFAAALVLVLLVGSVPFVGGIAVGLLSLAGVGACLLELYRRRHPPPAAAAPVPAGPLVDSGAPRSS